MEGAETDAGISFGSHLFKTGTHLPGSCFGKSNDQDLMRGNAASGDQILGTLRDYRCLSAAGACQNQAGASCMRDSFFLGWI